MALFGHGQQQCTEALRTAGLPTLNQTTVSRWLRKAAPTKARTAIEEYCSNAEQHARTAGVAVEPLAAYVRSQALRAKRSHLVSRPARYPDVTVKVGHDGRDNVGPSSTLRSERLRLILDQEGSLDSKGTVDVDSSIDQEPFAERARQFQEHILEPRMSKGQPLSGAEILLLRDAARTLYGIELGPLVSRS